MALAIFDLDNTLLSGDSDYLWGVFLGEQGIVDADYYEKENQRFYQEYKDGKLNIMEFLQFSLRPLAENDLQDLLRWRQKFIDEKIRPIIPESSLKLIRQHEQQGDTLMIITATNAFVTQPIAELMGISHLIATEPEFIDGSYTGRRMGHLSHISTIDIHHIDLPMPSFRHIGTEHEERAAWRPAGVAHRKLYCRSAGARWFHRHPAHRFRRYGSSPAYSILPSRPNRRSGSRRETKPGMLRQRPYW